MDALIKFQAINQRTLSLYSQTMGVAFPATPKLNVIDDDTFAAAAVPEGLGVQVSITSGVLDTITKLWTNALTLSDNLPEESRLNVGDIDQAIDTSLTWLMLHELHHFEMGHFKLTGGMGLVEGGKDIGMGLTSRSAPSASPLASLDIPKQNLMRRCMELQADHDSTEMLLDAYSTDGWEVLRFYAACVMAVMILIEKEEGGVQAPTYPKAATRIFQTLGHLAELWSVPARVKAQKNGWDNVREEDLPPTEEIEAYHAQVVAPAFADALILARANGAQSVIDDLGDPTLFIADIRTAQLPNGNDPSAFHTPGAKEWSELWSVNSEVMALLELEGLETAFVETDS